MVREVVMVTAQPDHIKRSAVVGVVRLDTFGRSAIAAWLRRDPSVPAHDPNESACVFSLAQRSVAARLPVSLLIVSSRIFKMACSVLSLPRPLPFSVRSSQALLEASPRFHGVSFFVGSFVGAPMLSAFRRISERLAPCFYFRSLFPSPIAEPLALARFRRFSGLFQAGLHQLQSPSGL